MIPGDDLRSGHRAERLDRTGPLKSRLRRNQRKGDQGEHPLHPDTIDVRKALIHTDKENVPPEGKNKHNCTYFTVKKYIRTSNIGRDKDVGFLFSKKM